MRSIAVVLDLDANAGRSVSILDGLPDGADVRTVETLDDGVAALPTGGCESCDAACVVVSAVTATTGAVAEAVTRLRAAADCVPILLVTGDRPADEILRLLDAGCDDFEQLPVCAQLLRARIERLQSRYYQTDPVTARLTSKFALRRIVGESPALREALARVPLLAGCEATVLIDGETGTGKEVCARAIHYLGPRAGKPFVPVNCGAIPIDLVENELFGHERAAYTGASVAGEGLVAEAEGGTLFLDEIDALPPKAQVKLLRLLQEKEYRPLGSTRSRKADVRFLAATNRELAAERDGGSIREDFYYRISVFRLTMPPLRERGHDVILLAESFIKHLSDELGHRPPTLSPAASRALLDHHWPGNIRELRNVIQRAVILVAGGPMIEPCHVELGGETCERNCEFRAARARALERFEVSFLEKALSAHGGNVTHSAIAAGKDPRVFRRMIRKHGIDLARFRPSPHKDT